MYRTLVIIIILTFVISGYMFFKKKNKKEFEPEQKNFYMKLSFIRKEKSKDSNSQETAVIIENDKIRIDKNNYGFKAQPNASKKFKFTKEKKENLINYIVANKLNKNVRERNEKLAIGIHTDINLELIIEGKKTQIEVFGMVNYWGSNNKTQKKAKVLEYYKKIDSLLSFIEMQN
jgi:hypothetical protein